jgi:LPXTG-motif cell wall-anchored protein
MGVRFHVSVLVGVAFAVLALSAVAVSAQENYPPSTAVQQATTSTSGEVSESSTVAANSATSGSLPFTGSDTSAATAVALLALVGGAALVAVVRRRREARLES